MRINFSNSLSLVRAPLAIVFLQENTFLRLLALLLAMITDSIDGYFARRNSTVSKVGTILDPAMDKFFVYFVLSIFFIEGKIKLWQTLAMLSRDLSLCIFGIYLSVSKKWKAYEFKAIYWGKITTALQFCILTGLTFNFTFSGFIYLLFILLGILAFFELFQTKPSNSTP